MRPLALVSLLLLLLAARPAAADPVRPMKADARKHFDAGLSAYGARDYARAIEEFAAGYAIDPHPDFVFPWAQAERQSGDCAAAIVLYRKVLDTGVDDDERHDVERLLDLCEADAVAGPEPTPSPGPASPPTAATPRRDFVAATTADVEATTPASDAHPWYRDGWGAALSAGGVIGLAVGAGFLYTASNAEEDSGDAGNLGMFIDDTDRANRDYAIGAVSIGVGAALLAGGVIRYALSGSF